MDNQENWEETQEFDLDSILSEFGSGAVEEAVAVQIAPVLERVRRMLGMVAKDKGVSEATDKSEDKETQAKPRARKK